MELPSPEPAPEEMVVKAEHVNEHPSDGKKYQFTIDLMKEGEIMISVFNTDSGITYKTTIKEDSLWFKSNIYTFRGDFSKVLSILRDSLMNDIDSSWDNVVMNKESFISLVLKESSEFRVYYSFRNRVYFELNNRVKNKLIYFCNMGIFLIKLFLAVIFSFKFKRFRLVLTGVRDGINSNLGNRQAL